MLEVIVYGNGDLYWENFNAIAASMGSSTYKTLIELTVFFAGTTAAISFISNRNILTLVKWLGIYYLAIYMLFLPKTSIEIIDRCNGDRGYAVDNVPLGLALMANITTSFGDILTQLLESNFSLPDDLRYNRAGMVMASKMVLAHSQFKITDPVFADNMRSFLGQCVFYDLLLKRYTFADLENSSELWPFIKDHSSKARAFLYNGRITTCSEGAVALDSDWNKIINEAIGYYAPQLFTSYLNQSTPASKTDRTFAIQAFKTYLPASLSFLSYQNVAASSEALMQQAMMTNALENGFLSMGADADASAAVQSYAISRAQVQTRLTYQTAGEQASEWLSIKKVAFESILYGSFILILLAAIFPFGLIILRNYFKAILSLQMWAPIYAILNLIVSYYAAHRCGSLVGEAPGISLKMMTGMYQINKDVVSMTGYLSFSVPVIAWYLLKGFEGVFVQLAQSAAGIVQSGITSGASEAATGNISLGNTNLGNQSMMNASAYHWDTSGRVSSGALSYSATDGSTVTLTSSGREVVDTRGSMSQLGTSVNLANAIRSAASQQADVAYSAAESKQHAYSDSFSSALRTVNDLTHAWGQQDSNSTGWSKTHSFGEAKSTHENVQLAEKFEKAHHLSQGMGAQILNAAYVEEHVGVQAGIGANLGLASGSVNVGHSAGLRKDSSFSESENTSKLYSEARDFIHSSNYAHNLDEALRSTKEESYRTGSEHSNRYADQFNTSIDHAKSARDDMTSQYQRANSFRKLASYAEENAVSVNTNLSQELLEWTAKQHTANSHGAMGLERARNELSNPVSAQYYAERFAHEYGSSIIQKWDNGFSSSGSEIKKQFEQNNRHIQGASTVKSDYAENHEKLSTKTNTDHIHTNPVNNSIRSLVDKDLLTGSVSINQENEGINNKKNESVKEITNAISSNPFGKHNHEK